MKKKNLPICKHAQAPTKCFACEDKRCTILTSVRGLRTPCPFYKSLKDHLDGLEKYPFTQQLRGGNYERIDI